jgi:peptidoglycan/LPS O-acetylase OafA/YrhL
MRRGSGSPFLELGVALILIAPVSSVGSAVLARGTGWIRAVGRCSYEIYLTHMLVVLGLVPFIMESKPAAPWILAWYALLLLSERRAGMDRQQTSIQSP